VIIKNGYLCTGVLEKSQFGSSQFGLVHAMVELYSPEIGGLLLGALGRLFSRYLQEKGMTCGMDDLLITPEAEKERQKILAECRAAAMQVSAEMVGCDLGSKKLMPLLNKLLRDPAEEETLDRKMMAAQNPFHKRVVDSALPKGQYKPFPENKFALMHTTGAKGSQVNHSQISCLLGQQALEGRRVPRMVSGKTLPSFEPYDPSPIAGGFIGSRYLTGLKPQEYFFHCMAGREGLVDTAVKTSRSGYLQRCLIKHLEGMKVGYDGSVRDTDGGIVQFNYGEDGINVQDAAYLQNFAFFAENHERFSELISKGMDLDGKEVQRALKQAKKRRKAGWRDGNDPIISKQNAQANFGAVSEKYDALLEKYIADDKGRLLSNEPEEGKLTKDRFRALMYLKYQHCLAHPGEAVGLLASQSVGEPSTQMTLNTFHHAGQADFNVTMGIPRMREVIMTASQKIKTPMMTLPLLPHITREQAETVCYRFYKLKMMEVLENITVKESIVEAGRGNGERKRQYLIQLSCKISKKHIETYGLKTQRLEEMIESQYIPKITVLIAREIKRVGEVQRSDIIVRRAKEAAMEFSGGAEDGDVEVQVPKPKKSVDDESDDDDDGEEKDADAELASMRGKKKEKATYEDDDDTKDKDEEGDVIEDEEPAKGEDESDEVSDISDGESEKPSNRPAVTPPKPTKRKKEKTPGSSKAADSRRGKLLGASEYLHDFQHEARADEEGGYTLFTEVALHLPPQQRKLLIAQIAEEAAQSVLLNALKGINRAGVVDRQGKLFIQTDGVNFEVANQNADVLDIHAIQCNDIVAILNTYGVEAARSTIASEVNAVFAAYGITSDMRHLGLLADYMTFQGGYRPLNRIGIASNVSPFLKMSFETTATFLEHAATSGEIDDMRSPSACIVLGKPVSTGTGSFDVMQPLQFGKGGRKN